jgi:hypothetical protein
VALADGGVVEVGSHDQLMAAKGFGHNRCMSQFRSGAAPAGRFATIAASSAPVRAGSARHQEPLVLNGHERSVSAN